MQPNMDRYLEKAKQIIAENIYMTIATTSINGNPWISPVFFAYDSNYSLFWVSSKDSKHSQLIRKNPQVAIVIFDSRAPEGEGDGVYFEAKVEELSDESEIKQAMKVLNKRVTKDEFRVKKVGEVTNEGVWRIYKAIPIKVSKLTEGEFVNGQYVDKRIEVSIADK